MKSAIHPHYYEAKVICSCGNTFTVGSTREEIKVEICALCHPFFTGQSKLIDTEGRVERFQRKMQTAKAAPKKTKKKVVTTPEAVETPRTLKEMLSELQES